MGARGHILSRRIDVIGCGHGAVSESRFGQSSQLPLLIVTGHIVIINPIDIRFFGLMGVKVELGVISTFSVLPSSFLGLEFRLIRVGHGINVRPDSVDTCTNTVTFLYGRLTLILHSHKLT